MSEKLLLLLVSFILLILTSGCASTGFANNVSVSADDGAADDHGNDEGHSDGMTHMHVEAPDEFAALKNPLVDDHEALEAGEETFNTLCATCHGPEGKGDGPGAAELNPKPADLSDGEMLGSLSDGYLFWRVSKGGAIEPFNSAMPAWEEGLTEEQRWQVIAYLRTLSEPHRHMEEMDDGHMEADDHDG